MNPDDYPFPIIAYASVALRFFLFENSDWSKEHILEAEDEFFCYLDLLLAMTAEKQILSIWSDSKRFSFTDCPSLFPI
jgi:hypothetical protein